MGGTCSTHDKDKKYLQYFGWNLKVRDHSEELGVDRTITFEWILGK